MILRRDFNGALALLLAFLLACPPTHALVNLNDGHDHIYVTGRVGFGWDSNVFANSDAQSDTTINASILAEYQRRAGWIGVDASVQLDASRYNNFKTENFNNPKFNAELTKQTGRTTGSLTLSAAKQSRADAAVNIRTSSWSYAAGLNFRYPIVTVYTVSGSFGYSFVKYDQDVFPQLATYTASVDLIRLFSSERDVMIGYRFRHGETSVDTSYVDHALTAGMTGKLIRGINGSLRAGYQTRSPRGRTAAGDSGYNSWMASMAATYAFNKRTTFTASVGKDFSNTANDMTVDTTTASLDAQYALSSRWSLGATVSAGDSKFLGEAGRRLVSLGPPPVYVERHDNFLSASASVGYSLNQHLKVSASYAWFKNWSTESIADFVRSSYNLNIASRW